MPALNVGQRVEKRTLTTVSGRAVTLPDDAAIVHLQFRRHAGCPICGWHLKTFADRREQLRQAKPPIREIIFFHSTKDELDQQGESRYDEQEIFDIISDPERKIYQQFGATRHWTAQYMPMALLKLPGFIAYMGYRWLVHGIPPPPFDPIGGRNQRPAEMLIGTDGSVNAIKYGNSAVDCWHFDEVLSKAKSQ